MSLFELNKLVGAILFSALFLVVIGKIGDNLVGGGSGGHEVTAPVVAARTTPAVAPKPAEPEIPFAELLARADVDRGKKVFAKCKACHTTAEGGKNGIGPNLWNVVNSVPGERSGFKYSKVMRELQEKPWNYDNLNLFLTKPKDYAKGTKMTFVGLRKASDRAHVIMYLRSLSSSPAPLN